jgi:hypothetical protein
VQGGSASAGLSGAAALDSMTFIQNRASANFLFILRSIAAHTASDGLIWPEDGFASIALPQRRSPTSFPSRLRRHSSRTKQVCASPSSASLRLETECGVDRSRPVDRHRGCDGRGLETEIRGELPWRTSAPSRRSIPSFRARS